MKKIVISEKAPKPSGPYSQAIAVGKWVFVSGQLAINPKEGKIIAGSITNQTRQVMENISSILETCNCSLNDIVQCNVFLSSMTLFNKFNEE